jgi:hypothetical protein
LGTIITHALVNEEGSYTVAVESGEVLYWHMEQRAVIFKEAQPDVRQLFLYGKQKMCIAVSRWEQLMNSFKDISCILPGRGRGAATPAW